MKKVFAGLVVMLVIILVVSSCKKKSSIYEEDLNGTWQVYKYLLYNFDNTQQFQAMYPGYSIAFTQSGQFTETYANPAAADTNRLTGKYFFTNNDEKIVLEYSYLTLFVDSIHDTTWVAHTIDRPYTIFNLTKNHAEFKNDSSQLYMTKIQ